MVVDIFEGSSKRDCHIFLKFCHYLLDKKSKIVYNVRGTTNKTMDMQYTDEWFDDYRKHEFDWEDLKAIKKRLEHLPKMMDELNELLKNGERRKADSLALNMSRYIQRTSNAIESDYEYISWGRADMMVIY